ncbi:MAG: methyltransferase domain-containing protein [Acidobacteria bacterium]|nr:MAG: methyltransferase domain-containing protein [Acidobacteriota bacterium]
MSDQASKTSRTSVRVDIVIDLEPSKLFDLLVEELQTALIRVGIVFEPGANGRIVENKVEVGRVKSWKPGKGFLLDWCQASWQPEEVTEIELRLESVESATRATFEHRGWGGLMSGPEGISGWFAGLVVAPFLRAATPAVLGDWLTDRGARRPSGRQARETYRDPLYHYPNFRVILAELALKPQDYLLEVGCGGGALLKDALQSGCRAAAMDHSPDMVRVAREVNSQAVAQGRLKIFEADAERLPFPDGTFTCAAMTGVLGFLSNPVAVFREIRRVLAPGGRLVVLGSDPELKGTPGAPEPMASRLLFYEDDELGNLAREADFEEVRVVRRDLEPFAREVGIPEEHIPLFAGLGTRFLLARRL